MPEVPNRTTSETGRLFHYGFDAARDGFRVVLEKLNTEKRQLLLPAYIGQSTREGSGIYDPVRETAIQHLFYRFDSPFSVDLNHLETLLNTPCSKAILLVNYFGFPYFNKSRILELCRAKGTVIIEDCAHSLFSFYRNQETNYDFAFFSLHKMFSYAKGGVLLSRVPLESQNSYDMDFFRYDLPSLSDKRRENYQHLMRLCSSGTDKDYQVIFSELGTAVPQTFPILLSSNKLKDHLYFEMNQAGYGVVSLYHTLINPSASDFHIEHMISSRILNLPVHQDCKKEGLTSMYEHLMMLIRAFNGK